jgi:hypothetical protein
MTVAQGGGGSGEVAAADVDDADAVWPLTHVWRVWRKSREARTEEGFGSCRCDRGVIRFQLPICHTFTLSGLDSVTL